MIKAVKILSTTIITLGGILLYTNALANNKNNVSNANDRYLYIGGEFGISEPVIKSFIHKESSTKMRLKQSKMYGGKVGYSFYPNMKIELSGTHQPKYRLSFRLPEQALSGIFSGITIPETPGQTKVFANVFTVNLVYEFQKVAQLAEIQPYVIFGAGFARVTIEPQIASWKTPASLGNQDVPFFKIKKNTINCFAWQVGGGISKDLTTNFSVDFSVKLQVVNNIKIKYDTLVDIRAQVFAPSTPIKKTLGVGEFTLGFTYKLPF